MKKRLLAIVAVAVFGLAATQAVEARPGMGQQGMKPGYGQQNLDPATKQAQEKFFKETTELRKQMAAKRAEMHALMSGTNPDGQKAARLSEELFDLREQLRSKAQAAGLPAGMGMGGGMCGGPCAGGGMMMGKSGGMKGMGGW